MKFVSLLTLIICLCGCQTAPHNPKPTRAETISALTTVTQGLTGLSAQHTVKYCPEDGERFSADMIWCPDHKVKLEWVE